MVKILKKIKSYFPHIIFIETILIIMLCGIVRGMYKADTQSVTLPSGDTSIARVTVTPKAPLKGLNKQEAYKAGIIAKDVEKNPDSAVLASGKVVDDSGGRTVTAVLNVKDGNTQIVEKRPFMEFMKRLELGAGYGFESGDQAKAVQLRATIGRLDRIYFTGQAELFEVDRIENKHPWNTMGFVNLRF